MLALRGLVFLLELSDRPLQGLDRVVLEPAALQDRVVDALVLAPDVVEELPLEPADLPDRDDVELAGAAGPDRDDLLLDRERRVLRLLEQLDQPGSTGQLVLRGFVQVGAERRERLQLAVLREVEPQPVSYTI
jgi:hypothetical protein